MRGVNLLARGVLACCVLVLLVASVDCEVAEAEAAAAVFDAQDAVAVAFDAVLAAEQMGADVSALLDPLNAAGGLLADAWTCYRQGNWSGTVHFADLVRARLSGIEAEAEGLANAAAVARGTALSWMVGVSIFGIGLVVAVGYLAWGRVRAWYLRRLLRMRPEVTKR